MSSKLKGLFLLVAGLAGILFLLVMVPHQAARGERDPARCAEIAEARYVARHGLPPPPRVAFLTTNPDRFFHPNDLARYRLLPVRSLDALTEAEGEGQPFDALMLDPKMFRQVPETWLRQQYRQGVPIIVLNVDYTEVAARLRASVSPGFDHYDPQFRATYIVYFYYLQNEKGVSTGVYVERTDRIPFDSFYRGVLLKSWQGAEMGFSQEYLKAVEACLYGEER